MASGPITSWQIDGETMGTETLFYWDPKITADGNFSHEIKRHLLLGRKVMTNLDSILKSRDYFASKGPYCQSYGFSSSHVWMWKKAKSWRTKAFELWCWRILLRVPWTERRSNQSILKEISTEYSLEGLMLKLKLQYIGHLMWRTNLLENTLMLGKIEAGGEGDDREWDGWMDHQVDGHEFEQAQVVGDGQGSLVCCSPWVHKELDTTERLNWTDINSLWLPIKYSSWGWTVSSLLYFYPLWDNVGVE